VWVWASTRLDSTVKPSGAGSVDDPPPQLKVAPSGTPTTTAPNPMMNSRRCTVRALRGSRLAGRRPRAAAARGVN